MGGLVAVREYDPRSAAKAAAERRARLGVRPKGAPDAFPRPFVRPSTAPDVMRGARVKRIKDAVDHMTSGVATEYAHRIAFAHIRWAAWHVMFHELHLSKSHIGRVFSKHHTTVMAGIARVEEKIEAGDMLTLAYIHTFKMMAKSRPELK